jgi:hypothetical protein
MENRPRALPPSSPWAPRSCGWPECRQHLGCRSNEKLNKRQQGLVEHPYNQKGQTRKEQDRQIPAKHQLPQAAQPLTPCEPYPGSSAFSADVFAITVPVAILAINCGATGGTNCLHIRTVRKIGGFAPVPIEAQLKCTCVAVQLVWLTRPHVWLTYGCLSLPLAHSPCQTTLLSCCCSMYSTNLSQNE